MVALEKGLSTAMNAKLVGTGEETIVLAHGYGGDQSCWDKMVPDLAKYVRVLVFDWMFSSAIKDQQSFNPEKYASYDAFADDLICLLEEMNLKSSPVVFVGHSMSGMIGCIASIKRPELFKRLILVGASPRYMNTEDYEGGFKKSDIEDIMSNIESDFQNWVPAFVSLVVDAKDPESVEKFTKCLSSMKPEYALSVAKTVFYSDQREILDKVTIPCTIVQTTRDIVVPNSVVYYMQEKIKATSTLEFIDTDGHFPHLTAHNQLLDVFGAVLGLSSC